MHRWQVLSSRAVVEKPWLTVHEQRVRLPSGLVIPEYHLIEGPDWVGILGLTERGQLVVVEQYRHGVEAVTTELPAGAIDAGEAPLEAARRELREETGHEAERWEPLFSLSTEPTRHRTRAHFFVARGLRRVAEPALDPTEQLEVRLLPVAELPELLAAGRFVHAVHVAALYAAMARGLLQGG